MNKRNIITVKSFWSTGGSAVNDLLSEFSSCFTLREQEFIFFESLDGLIDLENRYSLNRHNIPIGSQIARYKKLVDCLSRFGLYTKPYDSKLLFDGYFKKRSYEFLENISLKKTKASIAMEWHMINPLIYIIFYKAIPRIKVEVFHRLKYILYSFFTNMPVPRSNLHPKSCYYIPTDYKTFEIEVTKYVNDLFNYLLNKKNIKGKHLVLDQMLNYDCFNRYQNRIENLKYIIVDRDPRDIYISRAEKWNSLAVPDNVDDFIKWYRAARSGLNDELKSRCLFIRFEDLVYNYENTLIKIMKYTGLKKSEHIKMRQLFNPDVSIINTQLFKKTDKHKDAVKKIESQLKDYLYDFPYFQNNNIKDIF